MSLYTRRRAGRATAGTQGTISFDMEPATGLPGWQDLYNIQGTLSERSFRFENGIIERTINATAAQMAIATTGVATITPGSDAGDFSSDTDWEEGTLLVIGTNAYTFERFIDDDTAEVKPVGTVASNLVTIDHAADISAAVNDSDFAVYEFAVRRSFKATIETIADTLSADSGSVTVTMRPDAFIKPGHYILDNAARDAHATVLMPIRVRGLTDTRRTLRRLRGTRIQRIASQTVTEGIEEVYRTARRAGFGFVNRTGRLRRSLRIEQARDVRGRFATGKQLTARTPYAYWVEWKRRTRDRRPGPPYWLSRALQVARRKVARRMRRTARQGIEREWRRR